MKATRTTARWPRSAAIACLFACLFGCGSEDPTAKLISPQLGDPCRYVDCGDYGVCVASAAAGPVCECEDGHAGEHCEEQVCAPGNHWDALHHCVRDRRCEDEPSDPCGMHGACEDERGVIACLCDTGYEGPRCNLCKSGFARNEDDDCLQVVLGPGCSAGVCGAHGSCEERAGKAVCLCDVGYLGEVCSRCSAGFHETSEGRCVVDESCLDSSCSGHGTCSVSAGRIVCACNPEYTSTNCEACAAGHHRQDDGACIADPLCDERSTDVGPIDFDALSSFPNAFDSCVAASEPMHVDTLTMLSTGGTGSVWKCGPSLLNGLTSRHVVLEAGATSSARMSFGGTISQLRFEYAARLGALSVDVIADGSVIGSLSKPNNAKGSYSADFDVPVTTLELRSKSGVTVQIAIDDITYTLVSCEP